jgi:3-phosphoshikimate 1-carboxyvinyltransferase
MKTITPKEITGGEVTVPGSKSYTHRILIASALSDGLCRIQNALKSEDTLLTLGALRQMGVETHEQGGRYLVYGSDGELKAADEPIYLGNSGTSMRLLTAVASLGRGTYTLTGTERMTERPIQDLIDGLKQLGIAVRSVRGNGCPPVTVEGGRVSGGTVSLRCDVSSQYLSGLLLIAPFTERGVDINIVKGLVSKPYVDMTVEVMARFGVTVDRKGYDHFRIAGGQSYRAGDFAVEPDCSQAGYFWGAAAITGARIKVKGLSINSRQGDIRFPKVLEAMGCRVEYEPDGISVIGESLLGIETDMSDMPDMVPTLAVVAAFAKGTTTIKNVAHLKAKESDRLGSVVKELSKMGIEADCDAAQMIVKGGRPHGAVIETYNDHRMAMSFAMAGLKVPGVAIENESCVEKSFPNFWEVFGELG